MSDFLRPSSTSTSSPRYPERFLKVLEARVQLISTGRDTQYNDILLRYTFGTFYGKMKDPKHTRMMKESRKLEDLLMTFIATATESLRKNTPANSDEWKWRLEEQLEAFVDILGTALRNKDLRHVPPELITKLESLKSKISANRPSPAMMNGGGDSNARNNESSAGYSSARTSLSLEPSSGSSMMSPATSAGSTTTASTSSTVSYNLADIPAARQLSLLFDLPSDQVQRDINHLRKTCTEKVCSQQLWIVYVMLTPMNTLLIIECARGSQANHQSDINERSLPSE